jgi:hypothetical protein
VEQPGRDQGIVGCVGRAEGWKGWLIDRHGISSSANKSTPPSTVVR